ncbi:ABC transporter, permease protein [[Clostridium] scindens ATCC 35704]|nr:sugar ABC transporter permease [[Clostridium] scindens]EDS08808.1 ABC transporter, permease protein [[Clostridium] scindens ATCC 35704]QRO38907.1 sugar ABC transporter permease [[Clostridium] scindens]
MKQNRRKNEIFTAYLFVLPDLIGLLIFVVVPIIFAVYISFHQWNLVSDKVFIGIDNYKKLFSDKEWWNSLLRTFKFTLIYVPTLFVLALLFANAINYLKGKLLGFVRTAFLMPYAITSVIAATLWMFLYDEKRGYINAVLNVFGIPDLQYLGAKNQAMIAIIVVVVWINLGYNMILFLSAMKEIPYECIEAAKIDGAGKWKTFRHITFPLIQNTSVFILITSTIASFQMLDQIMVMTRGGPAKSTEVAVLYIYQQSFDFLNMGYASALSVVLFLILLVFSFVQMKFMMKDN